MVCHTCANYVVYYTHSYIHLGIIYDIRFICKLFLYLNYLGSEMGVSSNYRDYLFEKLYVFQLQ